jgi:hypothetical protein
MLPMPKGSLVGVAVCFVASWGFTPGLAQETASVEKSFKQFMQLALKNPSSYGFTDREEAINCRLGRCYGFYSKEEWAEAQQRMAPQDLANPELAPEKVYEVNTPTGETRCTFVLARQPADNVFRPVILGRQDIAHRLQSMRAFPHRERLVLILDIPQKKLSYADASNPASILMFP